MSLDRATSAHLPYQFENAGIIIVELTKGAAFFNLFTVWDRELNSQFIYHMVQMKRIICHVFPTSPLTHYTYLVLITNANKKPFSTYRTVPLLSKCGEGKKRKIILICYAHYFP